MGLVPVSFTLYSVKCKLTNIYRLNSCHPHNSKLIFLLPKIPDNFGTLFLRILEYIVKVLHLECHVFNEISVISHLVDKLGLFRLILWTENEDDLAKKERKLGNIIDLFYVKMKHLMRRVSQDNKVVDTKPIKSRRCFIMKILLEYFHLFLLTFIVQILRFDFN